MMHFMGAYLRNDDMDWYMVGGQNSMDVVLASLVSTLQYACTAFDVNNPSARVMESQSLWLTSRKSLRGRFVEAGTVSVTMSAWLGKP